MSTLKMDLPENKYYLMIKKEADQTKEDLERAKLMQARDLTEDKMDQNEELAELRANTSLAKAGIKEMSVLDN